jgi:sarcosine oxidase subunit beta
MRQQWATPEHIELAKHSLAAFRRFREEVGRDIGYVEGGYLLPASREETVAAFRRNIALQNEHGVPSRLLAPGEIAAVAPLLDTRGLRAAAYCATDARAYPFDVVLGYAGRAREMGARLHTYTRATALRVRGRRVTAVETDRGTIACDWVVNAAGPHVAEVAAMAGAHVPVTPYRREAFVTEPVAPCLGPLVLDLEESLYFSQTAHGPFVLGQSNPYERPGFNYREHWQFEASLAARVVRRAPALRHLKVVRHWAGHYAMTPDRRHILGRFGDQENFLIAGGYSGHGFMMCPVSGRLVAELITKGRTETVSADPFSIDRFRSGHYAVEANVV